ncbi:YueI family protein [Furfurilactobacillus curtus]|uniref:DUF1694 domain-containing protein n=1 Tax=Furfurilactobacillus curtus TaxID=1746200 RepID=A0ABQ5JNZ2_9LACO
MSDQSDQNVDPNQRLSNAIYGAPKVNPDEQRHYLGTFRERVTLSMSVAELKSGQYLDAFTTELEQQDEQNNTILLNGNLGQDTLGPYIRAATMHAVAFTIKNDPQYGTDDADLALVITAKAAVDVSPIDVAAKHPQSPTNTKSSKKPSFWQRLFNQ